MMRISKGALFQVLLVSSYSVVFLFSRNLSEVVFLEFFVNLGIFLLLGLSCFGLSFLFFADGEKAGIFSTCCMFLFLYFVPISLFLDSFRIGTFHIFRARYLIFLIFILLIFLFFLLRRPSNKEYKKHYFFSHCLIIPYLLLFLHSFAVIFIGGSENFEFLGLDQKNLIDSDIKLKKPSVFYIIVDGYVSQDTMKRRYIYDNSEFINFLKTKDFYVPNKSCSNYPYTRTSLPSSLNMSYLYPDFFRWEKSIPDDKLQNQMVSNNIVGRLFKDYGYVCKNIPPSGQISRSLKIFDEEHPYTIWGDFTDELLRTTILGFSGSLVGSMAEFIEEEKKRRWIAYQFEKLKECAKSEEPQFVFAHILCPHPPFVFDEHGNSYSYHSNDFWRDYWNIPSYVRSIKYLNSKLMEVISHIISESVNPPVIIIQGDHGTAGALLERKGYLNYNEVHSFLREELQENFGILNAYYMPNGGAEKLYDSISPVNTFRMIFNHYLGTNFELLPDNSYVPYKGDFLKIDHLFKDIEG